MGMPCDNFTSNEEPKMFLVYSVFRSKSSRKSTRDTAPKLPLQKSKNGESFFTHWTVTQPGFPSPMRWSLLPNRVVDLLPRESHSNCCHGAFFFSDFAPTWQSRRRLAKRAHQEPFPVTTICPLLNTWVIFKLEILKCSKLIPHNLYFN